MAVDKAIDSTEFDSKLTTVADAIRTAGGTTEPMSFPSGMVEAITAIQAGGGGGSSWTDSYSVFATGTFTPTEKVTEWSIDTGVPYSYHDSNNKLNYYQQSLIVQREPDGNALNGLVVATLRSYSKQYPDYNGGALGSLAGTAAGLLYREDTNAFPQEGETIWKIDGNSSISFMAGSPYRWILLGVLK